MTRSLEEAYSEGGGGESSAMALAGELKEVQRELPESYARWEALAEQLEQNSR